MINRTGRSQRAAGRVPLWVELRRSGRGRVNVGYRHLAHAYLVVAVSTLPSRLKRAPLPGSVATVFQVLASYTGKDASSEAATTSVASAERLSFKRSSLGEDSTASRCPVVMFHTAGSFPGSAATTASEPANAAITLRPGRAWWIVRQSGQPTGSSRVT